MITRLKKLFAAPAFEEEEKNRAASLLNALLLFLLVADVLIISYLVLTDPDPAAIRADLWLGIPVAVISLSLLFLIRRGYVKIAGTVFSSLLLLMTTADISMFKGIRSADTAFYTIVIAIAALLVGPHAALIFGLLSVLAALGVYYMEINDAIAFPMPAKVELADWIFWSIILVMMAFLMRYTVRSIARGFERAARQAQALAEINRELSASREALQTQAHDLTRRTGYLEATAAVAREAASVLDLQALLSRIVTLISERFGFYHTAIFLVDPTGEWAELCAASSEGGQRMLSKGHRLHIGGQSLVGHVISRGEPRIALDTGENAVRFDYPDLPETRSEVMLPLRARGEILGALDVQSAEPIAFGEEDVAALQTLADQMALAISNARLFQQAQEVLKEMQQAYGEISREAWSELLRTQAEKGYRYTAKAITPVAGEWSPTMRQAAQTGRSVTGDGALALAVPIKVHDQVVGVLNLRKSKADAGWKAEEIELLETLAEQLGVALESTRLFQETQRRAARERLTGEIVNRMRRAADMDTLLQTALQELTGVLGVSSAFVQLAAPPEPAEGEDRDLKISDLL